MRANGFLTVVIPFNGDGAEVERLLAAETGAAERTGNHPKPKWTEALNSPPQLIHFLSMAVAPPRSPMDSQVPETRGGQSHLMIEISSDSGPSETLPLVARALSDLLVRLLDEAKPVGWRAGTVDTDSLAAFLRAHHRVVGDAWGMAMGQVHDGSPGMTVRRIVDECHLANKVGAEIERRRNDKDRARDWLDKSPMQRLELLRDWIWSDAPELAPAKWVFIAEPATVLQTAPTDAYQTQKATIAIVHKLLWPIYIFLTLVLLDDYFVARLEVSWPRGIGVWIGSGIGFIVVSLVWWLRRPRTFPFVALVAPTLAVIAIFHSFIAASQWFLFTASQIAVVSAGAIFVVFLWLKVLEARDEVDDHTPDREQVRSLMAVENFGPQNHMFTISTIKSGLWRWLALRVILTMIGANLFVSRPGFLGKNGVIHSARWMWFRDPKLPWFRWFDPGRLVFWSNYDGTWDSYVGDFVADSPSGVTGLWSNCIGFPRARNLLDEGAKNRDRLVRWARRQQRPTTFFYSAYPDLTNARIRINAAIRQGLASGQSDADARDWLSLFGSQPRPVDALASNQIPTLVFGSLSSLPFATCYMLQLVNGQSGARAWLDKVRNAVTFGELLPGQTRAVGLALSSSALQKLGLPANAMSTFPVPFQEGMWTEERARALGDSGDDAPAKWDWGTKSRNPAGVEVDKTIDVFLLVYGKELEDMQDQASQVLDTDPAFKPVVFMKKTLRAPVVSASSALREAAGRPCEHGEAAPRMQRDHFGFVDGVSQPVIRGLRRSGGHFAHNDLVGPGEFVLGYPDNLQQIPPTPLIDASADPDHLLADDAQLAKMRPEFSSYGSSGHRDLGANGTFLVVRDLVQHVETWETFLRVAADIVSKTSVVSVGAGGAAIVWGEPPPNGLHNVYQVDPRKLEPAIAAKLIGRWQDGSPLARYPMVPGGETASVDNSFRLGVEDPQGMACPLGAHIRRANPRDTRFPGSQEEIDSVNRHRLLRVGRSYGDGRAKEGSPEEPGLMFMCLNADIERQFEFVQKTWLLNRNINALENEDDPLLGKSGQFSLPTARGIVRLALRRPLVTVRGGGYFFMPGAAALHFLATFGTRSSQGDVNADAAVKPQT